jgi:WD40 repeat protein
VEFWNVAKAQLVKIMDKFEVSVHSMVYKHDYMILATATYHTEVQIWGFNDADINAIGKLRGHIAQVTAVQNLVDTPMIVTADEAGVIKTWDIRSLCCFQTLATESKSMFHSFLTIHEN